MATRQVRQRKPLLPVQVTGKFVGGATRDDVIAGQAVLSIVAGDATDSEESAYWCRAVFQGDVCTGFRLTKFGTGDVYDVPRSLDTCDCPDRTYKPERPGGCRHMAALRQALPTVAKDQPAPARKPCGRAERDEATAGDHSAANSNER
jgi:hypothetical protein